jgi:recombination protein RecA
MVKRIELADEIGKYEPEGGPKGYYHSGSTMINLAGSGRGKDGGWGKGRIGNIVGDGSSGKTILALETCAIAKRKDTKTIIRYDNAEEVMDFDVKKMFSLSDSIFLPKPSTTVEEFGGNFIGAIKDAKGKPLIYVLDSLDSTGSEAERKSFLDAAEKGVVQDGSYHLERQRYMNQFFREYIVNNMKENVLLLIISQIRSKIGVKFGKKTYRTGGKALDFYTHQVVWIREKEKLDRTIKGHKRVYGIRVHAKFERNKVAKPFREAEFTVLYDYGIDDIGSMIDWMYGPRATELVWDEEEFTRATLIAKIEDEGLEGELAQRVERRWWEVEESFKPDRKEKY